VQFQRNAWADLPTILKSLDLQLIPWTSKYLGGKKFIVFMDNLGCQRVEEYIRKIEAAGGSCAFGPAWLTHAWAPIDRGHIGATLKHVAKEKFSDWLEEDSTTNPGEKNYEVWDRGKVTASQKRILCTWLFGEAWQTIQGPEFKRLRGSAFWLSGLAMTMTGVNDHGCCPEGFPDAIEMVDPSIPFIDEDYVKKCFSKHPLFFAPAPHDDGAMVDDVVVGDRVFSGEDPCRTNKKMFWWSLIFNRCKFEKCPRPPLPNF
jgi:hypothetical protein